MEKNYNSNRTKLNLREYGRNILQMVDSLKNIEDKKIRTQKANAIVNIMGNINPVLRDSVEFKYKLWDHLFILAGMDLDIDSPYPKFDFDINFIPDRLKYPRKYFSHKQYGNNIRLVIEELSKVDDIEIRNQTLGDVAKFMKFKSFEYNKEFPSDEVIIKDINKFAGTEMNLASDILSTTKINVSRPSKTNRNNKGRNNNGGKSSSSRQTGRPMNNRKP